MGGGGGWYNLVRIGSIWEKDRGFLVRISVRHRVTFGVIFNVHILPTFRRGDDDDRHVDTI